VDREVKGSVWEKLSEESRSFIDRFMDGVKQLR
jgi:hypothetical protein